VWQNFSEEFVSLMDAHEIKGSDIIFMIILLMKNGLLNNLLEPKNILEGQHFPAVEDYSQFIHEGIAGIRRIVMSPLMHYEMIRFMHEVLQMIPTALKSKSASDVLVQSLTFNELQYKSMGEWQDDEMMYEINVGRLL
jgi:hypothetical protein